MHHDLSLIPCHTVRAGSRGLRLELWNDTAPRYLSDIRGYHGNTTGYWSQRIDAMPHRFPLEKIRFSTRSRGFFVPPSTGNFTFYLHCDDRCELHLSNSSRPRDKVAPPPPPPLHLLPAVDLLLSRRSKHRLYVLTTYFFSVFEFFSLVILEIVPRYIHSLRNFTTFF